MTSFADFKLYKEVSKEIDEKLVGSILPNSIRVTGKSNHFINRVIGSVEQKRCGVSVDIINRSIHSEMPKIINTKQQKIGRSQKLRFEKNEFEITINIETGNLVQVNPWKRGNK